MVHPALSSSLQTSPSSLTAAITAPGVEFAKFVAGDPTYTRTIYGVCAALMLAVLVLVSPPACLALCMA